MQTIESKLKKELKQLKQIVEDTRILILLF